MRRLIPASGAIVLAFFFAVVAAAQYNGRLDGQVLDLQGKPYPNVTVKLTNTDTGQVFTIKSGKDGRIIQLGMKGGLYDVEVIVPEMSYKDKFRVKEGDENTLVINFKEIMAQHLAEHPEDTKKTDEEDSKAKNMQGHFKAGAAAMNDASDLKRQLATAPADQKAALQEKRAAICQNAINEYQQAEQAVGPKDIANHSTVWFNMGIAYECAGHIDDAASAFQKSIDLRPTAGAYRSLSTNLATLAVAQTDPKVTEAKLADAGAACDKAIAIDPTTAAACWKNIGIVLSNKGHLKEAVAPLQKATQADPKDAQSWFLLGGALTSTIDTKTEGGKEIYIIPPGTAEAYQSCIDAAPTGPYAPQAKEALDNLSQLSGGLDLTISKKKKK